MNGDLVKIRIDQGEFNGRRQREVLWVRFLLASAVETGDACMTPTRNNPLPSPQVEDAPQSAEDANRQAAVERACYLQGTQWIDDRRRRPGTPANRREGHSEG